jgi:TatD DNase family protein
MLVDTHCHLTFSDFAADLDGVVARAVEAGVQKVVVPGIDLETSVRSVELADQFPELYAAVGIHPQDSANFSEPQLKEFEALCRHPKVVAIGEIGLDYYRDYAPRDVQKRVFRIFLDFAREQDLPVIVHIRQAFGDLWTFLEKDESLPSGVFHCFSGTPEEANRLIERGFLVSFTGTITFKNSRSSEVAQSVPLKHQLLETDAPFMAPVPHRGKRNEPAFVRIIAEKLARLHGKPLEDVAQITTASAFRLFPKLTGTA